MLTKLGQYLGTIDFEEVTFFIGHLGHDLDMKSCGSPDKLIERLKKHVHVFKISLIQQIVDKFPNEEVSSCLVTYQSMKQRFLSGTRIIDFRSQLPGLSQDMCEVHFKIAKATAYEKALQDIDTLARDAFGPCYNYLSPMSRYPMSKKNHMDNFKNSCGRLHFMGSRTLACSE